MRLDTEHIRDLFFNQVRDLTLKSTAIKRVKP